MEIKKLGPMNELAMFEIGEPERCTMKRNGRTNLRINGTRIGK